MWEAFAAALPDAVEVERSSELDDALARLVSRAEQGESDLEVDPVGLVAHAATRIEGGPITPDAIDAIHAADLHLASACAGGDARGIAAFERRYASHLSAIIRRVRAAAPFYDEANQLVRQRLFVAPPGDRPKIAEYAGRGELLAFLRIVAVRVTLDLLRAEKRHDHAAYGDDEAGWELAAGDDPELDYFKRHYGAELRAAFKEAVGELSARERTLLRYHVIDRLSVDKIAAIYDVHRSTAARHVNGAKAAVIEATQRLLRSRLDVDDNELQSILRLVRSNVEVSVERLLGASG